MGKDRAPKNNEPTDGEAPPSKSERKRQMLALQALGERLVGLSEAELNTISIPDLRLREAVSQARRVTARGGLKRQLQYIGKLMRSVDPTPIEAGLAALDRQHHETTAHFHRVELLRDKLLSKGDAALGEVRALLPSAEPAVIRQLLRQHATESQRGGEKTQARKLFRYLASLTEEDTDEL
jgi:ribosome-associated protein